MRLTTRPPLSLQVSIAWLRRGSLRGSGAPAYAIGEASVGGALSLRGAERGALGVEEAVSIIVSLSKMAARARTHPRHLAGAPPELADTL